MCPLMCSSHAIQGIGEGGSGYACAVALGWSQGAFAILRDAMDPSTRTHAGLATIGDIVTACRVGLDEK
jgi:hypothetical protein